MLPDLSSTEQVCLQSANSRKRSSTEDWIAHTLQQLTVHPIRRLTASRTGMKETSWRIFKRHSWMLFLRQMLVHLLSLCIFMLSCLSLLCSTTHSSFLNSLSFNPQLFFFPPLNKVNICLACSRSSKESDHTPDFPPFSSYQRATFIKLFSSLCCQRLHWEISYYLNRSEVPN